MHRLNTFAKLIQLSAHAVVFVVGYRKWKFEHKDKKVIYNLIYCYEKSISGKYVNLVNKQLGVDTINMLESIGFFIDTEKGNAINSRSEFLELSRLISNPMPHIQAISLTEENDLLLKCNSLIHNYSFLDTIHISDADKSGFSDLLKKRKSNRRFLDNKIEKEAIFQIIHNGFGIKITDSKNISHHTSASAGSLYQIDLYMVLFGEDNELTSGKYFFSKKDSQLGLLGTINKNEFINNCFLPSSLDYSKINGMFVLTGNISYELEKYGHRTFLYQALEAGSIAQNMIITSLIHEKIKLLQFGGYFEEPLKTQLNIDKNKYILTSFLF